MAGDQRLCSVQVMQQQSAEHTRLGAARLHVVGAYHIPGYEGGAILEADARSSGVLHGMRRAVTWA